MSAKRRARVLVVEDNELNLELLQAVLVAAGFEVHTAADAHTALAIAHRVLPDVVLMDVQLPEMDGLAATRALHADPATAAIPVIAITAHVKKDDEERCLAAGCVAHVAKPIDTRALPLLVQQVVEQVVGGTT